MENKFELHPDLQDASLEKACEIANRLVHTAHMSRESDEDIESVMAADLSYMLEYLRLNFDLVPKK